MQADTLRADDLEDIPPAPTCPHSPRPAETLSQSQTVLSMMPPSPIILFSKTRHNIRCCILHHTPFNCIPSPRRPPPRHRLSSTPVAPTPSTTAPAQQPSPSIPVPHAEHREAPLPPRPILRHAGSAISSRVTPAGRTVRRRAILLRWS